jgi:hypothetical protein
MAQHLTDNDRYLTEEQIELNSHAASPVTAEVVDRLDSSNGFSVSK